jgi:heptosyltransferase-2
MSDPRHILVLAPNWLGDAVMALPAMADVRRAFPSSSLTVAARRSVIDVFALAPFVDARVPLHWSGRWWHRAERAADAARLRDIGAEVALLLPNSFASAWLVKRAGVPERWGYRTDLRAPLLSRAASRPGGSMHQGAYYQHLTRELGIDSGPLEPALTVPDALLGDARAFLVERGWDPSRPLVVFAPGAAYGSAKRWIPQYVARVVSELVREHHATCVLAGSSGDVPITRQVVQEVGADTMPHVIGATGATTIGMLAGMLALASACVSNDSGAMHLAAAVGTPLVTPFGPTNEYESAPLTREGRRAAVLTNPVWCRPCMLRECPIDHRCMTGISPQRVYDALVPMLSSTT